MTLRSDTFIWSPVWAASQKGRKRDGKNPRKNTATTGWWKNAIIIYHHQSSYLERRHLEIVGFSVAMSVYFLDFSRVTNSDNTSREHEGCHWKNVDMTLKIKRQRSRSYALVQQKKDASLCQPNIAPYSWSATWMPLFSNREDQCFGTRWRIVRTACPMDDPNCSDQFLGKT